MADERQRGWLKRRLERVSKEVQSWPVWMKPEEMRLAAIQKMENEKNDNSDSEENR